MAILKWINVALRGIMEMGIILAFGYWGFYTGKRTAMKILLGIGTPLLGFGFWGLVDFHQMGKAAELLRLVQELLISGLAVLLLYLTGQPIFAGILALIAIVHHALVYLLGERLLKNKR